MGLGVLGRGVNLALFLAECGAHLTITDLKTKKELAPSLKKLTKHKNIIYVLGQHRKEDFRGKDIVVKAAGVPLHSPYIKEAKKNGTPVKMDASFFMELVQGHFGERYVTIVGVTGTKGKSTTTQLIHYIVRKAKKRTHLGGNVQGVATLPLLKKIRKGDIVVLELDSWQLQGFGDARLSPHVSVFTSFLRDHMNYYKNSMTAYLKDKSSIFRFQKKENFLLVSSSVSKLLRSKKLKSDGTTVVYKKDDVPSSWGSKLTGPHFRESIAGAALVAQTLGIRKQIIKEAIATFPGVKGRLSFVRKVGGVSYYNDTTATMPDAVICALKSFPKKRTILIAGGADKKLKYDVFANEVERYVKALILFEGKASRDIQKILPKKTKYPVYIVSSMKNAVAVAYSEAEKGDVVVLSPGAASFGLFKNEYDRGDQFENVVRKL